MNPRILEEALKLLSDACEEFVFGSFPEKAKEMLGESADSFIYETVSEGFERAFMGKIREVVGEVEPFKLVKAFFNFFELIGKPYDYKIISEKPLVIEVKRCPQRKMIKGKEHCVACLASLAGALKAAYGKVRLEAFGKAFGDEDAKVVIRREGELGKCLWKVEEVKG